jgi:hypothetical protein
MRRWRRLADAWAAVIAVTVVAVVGASVPGAGAATRDATPFPLGTYVVTSSVPQSCPQFSTCSGFEVTCPNVTDPVDGWLSVAEPAGEPTGVVFVLPGGSGTHWALNVPNVTTMSQILDHGLVLVQLQYATPWHDSSPGNDVGPAVLGCRSATPTQYVYDTYYAPLGLVRQPGTCGFCIAGNSGGASLASFVPAYYGMDGILDAVIMMAGPPYAALDKSCQNRTGEEAYRLGPGKRVHIDRSYGDFTGDGPCFRQDASFSPRWLADSVSTGSLDYDHPTTRMRFIWGSNDPTEQAIGGDYLAALQAVGTNDASASIAPNTAHLVYATPEGNAAFEAALFGAAGVPGVAISTGPSNPTQETTAKFIFATDDPTATMTCSLDGHPATACSSPVSIAGLANGTHTFEVDAADGNVGSATWSWAVGPPPTITSFSPTQAAVGDSVTVLGTALSTTTGVTVGGAAASFAVASDSEVDVTVPDGALTGRIVVTTPTGTATSLTNLNISPTVTSFSPPSGSVGTVVTISGSAFTGATSVTFKGVSAQFTVDAYGTISATVPAGAMTGKITVKTRGGTGKSFDAFKVI